MRISEEAKAQKVSSLQQEQERIRVMKEIEARLREEEE